MRTSGLWCRTRSGVAPVTWPACGYIRPSGQISSTPSRNRPKRDPGPAPNRPKPVRNRSKTGPEPAQHQPKLAKQQNLRLPQNSTIFGRFRAKLGSRKPWNRPRPGPISICTDCQLGIPIPKTLRGCSSERRSRVYWGPRFIMDAWLTEIRICPFGVFAGPWCVWIVSKTRSGTSAAL